MPQAIPVTAKMRLGVADTHRALDCARALAAGGVQELAVHGRTRQDGFRPPARWEWIARIREAVKLPVIANGEVWTVADYRAIRQATGCADVMLGRGAVADPLLAARIRAGCAEHVTGSDWESLRPLIASFWAQVSAKLQACNVPGRLKQWLGLLRRSYAEADDLYRNIRTLRTAADVAQALQRSGIELQPGGTA